MTPAPPPATFRHALAGLAAWAVCAALAPGAAAQDVAQCGDPPAAAFSASSTTPLIGQPVTFQDESTPATVSHWLWDFGDGARSEERHPTHAYQSQGLFAVRLSVDAGPGCLTATATLAISPDAGGRDPDRPGGGLPVAPTPDAGPDLAAAEGEPVRLLGLATDDEGDIEYLWSVVEGPEGLAVDADGAELRFTAPPASAPQPYTIAIELRVAKDGAVSEPDVVHVVVAPADGGPAAVAGAPMQAERGQAVRLDGSASLDPEGAALTYSWRQVGGVAVALSGADGPTPTFTVPMDAARQTLDFQLTVSDGRWTATDQVQVWVLPPDARAGLAVRPVRGDANAFAFSALRAGASYTWDFGDGTTARAPAAVHAYAGPGRYTVRLTVQEESGGTVAYVREVDATGPPRTYGVLAAEPPGAALPWAHLALAAGMSGIGAAFAVAGARQRRGRR